MAKIEWTDEAKKELLRLHNDHIPTKSLMAAAKDRFGIEVKTPATMIRAINKWEREIGTAIVEDNEKLRLMHGMEQRQRVSDWSEFRTLVRDRVIDQLRSGQEVKFSDLAHALLKADEKLATLLGIEDAPKKIEIDHNITVQHADLYRRIQEVKELETYEEADYEEINN